LLKDPMGNQRGVVKRDFKVVGNELGDGDLKEKS
jgi:hypothetical protein